MSTLIAPGQDAASLPPGAVSGQVTTASPTGMITLPSIPNPVPPPPQKVAVITPAAAQQDLIGKQGVTNQAAAAVSAQTQSNLAKNATSQQPQVTQQTNQPQGQQTTQQGSQTTQNKNLTAVTLPNGVEANYDTATGQMSTSDGKPLVWNQAQNGWVDPGTGAPPSQTSSTGVPSTGDPTTDYVLSQLKTNQQQADTNAATYQAQMQQILNGTFPLTADQQAQVVSLQQQFDQLKVLQEQANKNYVGATTTLGVRSGRNQYAPELASAQIQAAVSTGISKIAQLDTQASQAVSTLKQGFMDNNYKVINSAYTALQDAITQKNDTLTKMQDVIKNQVAMETERLQQQSVALAIQTTQVGNLAQSALTAALKLDGTLDLDAIQKIADENQIDPNALYGAVQKAHQDEIMFQQGESKFASDQLQAGAQLAATKQATSASRANEDLTRANIEKVKADTAATQAENSATNAASALGSQPAYTKLTAGQKTVVDGTNNLINALKEYKDLYTAKTDKSGGNYFGSDAAELASAYHSLIFQFSVAAGSGAIQKADAEQIEQIIPDPTSVSGIAKASVRGGQGGGVKALDNQINKFEANLKSYGLTPTDTSKAPTNVVPNPSGGEDIEITD